MKDHELRKQFINWFSSMMGWDISAMKYDSQGIFYEYSMQCAWIVYRELKRKDYCATTKRMADITRAKVMMKNDYCVLSLSTPDETFIIAERGSSEMNNLYNGYTLELERLHRDLRE